MRHLHLLIKPASGQCNLRCQYCFYTDEMENRSCASMGFMSLDLLEKIVIKALNCAEQECTFAFQGGEPTLIGLDFFKALIHFVQKHNQKKCRIHYALQTNGLCIDEKWAAFLAENHFLVGISLDGTKYVHDRFRTDRAGGGSFERVMHGIKVLQKFNVAFNILTVVTALTVAHVLEIYRFYKKNKLFFHQFIPCMDPLYSTRGQYAYSLTPEAYGQFLCNLFDLWYTDITAGNFIYIRYFENLVGMLKGFPPENCGMSGMCAIQHVIEADGSVYPCDFYVLDDYCLGNLQNDDFDTIARKRNEIQFIQGVRPADDCLKCQHGFICRGGCRRDRIVNPDGSLGKNYYCVGFDRFFKYAAARLVQLSKGSIQYKEMPH